MELNYLILAKIFHNPIYVRLCKATIEPFIEFCLLEKRYWLIHFFD
jgi:hypothetical protein